MITDSMKKDICFRLGLPIKYTFSGIYYWDKRQKQFVLCEGPHYWIWAINYYQLYFFEAFLFIYLRSLAQDVFNPEFEDTAIKSKKDDIKLLILVSGALFWILLTGIAAVMSVMNEFRNELCILQNQIFKLDETILNKFVVDKQLAVPPYPEKKHLELLIKFDCYVPLVLPILFGIAQFIPGEPMHSFMEWFLEIKFGWNWKTVAPWFMIVTATNGLVGVVITIIFFASTAGFSWLFWLKSACPDVQTMRKNWDDGILYFKTAHLGYLSETELIWMYRSFELITGLLDYSISNTRMAYHSFAQQITLVIAVFSLMRFQDIIFTGDLLGLALAFILVLAGSLSMFMMVLECYGLHELQSRSNNFRNALLLGTKRNLAINKTVRSFRDVTIHSAGSYFSVNRSTFAEWCDEALSRLVDCLCSI